MNACWGEACDLDADCPTDWACNFEADPANPTGAVRYSCAPGYGSLGAGEYCTANTDCASGACIDTGMGAICYGPCVDHSDCGGDLLRGPGVYLHDLERNHGEPAGVRDLLLIPLPR